jgi:hypothetical protein
MGEELESVLPADPGAVRRFWRRLTRHPCLTFVQGIERATWTTTK